MSISANLGVMQRLGRNRGGYFGERLPADEIVSEIVAAAHRRGWRYEGLDARPDCTLPVLTRPPRNVAAWAPRIYLSTGIHGDEPAGPLAVRRLISDDLLPDGAWYWLCPCLNPSGFRHGTRPADSGIDLNRDYRHLRTDEVRAHVAWLQRQPMFDLAFCLHEDWEAAGFYVYELNPDHQPSLADAMIDAARDVCPIDLSPVIDGRESNGGIIRPNLDPATRPEWPEAFYLLQNKTRLSYTLEAPSDFAMPVRVDALVTAVRIALETHCRVHGGRAADNASAPPP